MTTVSNELEQMIEQYIKELEAEKETTIKEIVKLQAELQTLSEIIFGLRGRLTRYRAIKNKES